MRRGALLPLIILLAACTCEQRRPPPRSTTKPVSAPTPDLKAQDPCAEIIKAYTDALERASLDCKTDADCGCYSGGLGPRSGCGGVVNRATLIKLQQLWLRFRDKGCRYTRQCAPRSCIPRCHQGQCVRASVGRRAPGGSPLRLARGLQLQ